MARANEEAIATFMSITGASEPDAIQKLEEHGGSLDEAVNAHFSEGDRNTTRGTSVAAPQDDLMEVDDPIQIAPGRPPFSLLPSARNVDPFSLLDPNLSIFGNGTDFTSREPSVSRPREIRQIPVEVKDDNEQSGPSSLVPINQNVTGTAQGHGPQTYGTVIIDDEDIPTAPTVGQNEGNDIEEEMIRAAIEASRRDAEIGYSNQSDPMPPQRQSRPEDADLAHAVSLSLKTAEQEKAVRDMDGKVGPSESEAYKSAEVEELGKLASASERQSRSEIGGSSVQGEEQPLSRHRSRQMSSGSIDTAKEIGESELSPPSSPLERQQHNNVTHPQQNESDFHLDEWGGISSLEHDEAVMLEAALFGGILEGSGYTLPYAPHGQFTQNGFDGTVGPYRQQVPRPPSPSLTAQRLIREQQDDEYLASLQADREKELKAREEGEIRLLEEQAAREAVLAEERRKEEESRKKLEEEQEIERQLAAKEASLPQEPSSDDENAITLLVRLPDGSRRGRRFLKSHKLQYLLNFIDVGRVAKPGTYRLVRPYPRRAFGDGESALTLNELGLTSKQEALFLELI